MVNPGHASKCCTTCKLRKIQCDLTHPFCRRCTKSGRVCLGYGERQTKGRIILHGSTMTSANRETSLSYFVSTSEDYDGSRQIKKSIIAASFLEMFLVGTNERNPENSESRHSLYITGAAQGSDKVAGSVMNIIRKCVHSLRQPLQSSEKRRGLLAEYSAATSELRATLIFSPHSPALGGSIFLFSMYEMIVNIDLEDRTWQIHLEGLLNILSQQSLHHRASYMDNFDTLYLAIQICKAEGDVFRTLATCEMNSVGKAFLILDVAMLCLRPLTSEVENLLKGATPRKIDVQKLRASVRKIQKNLQLFPKLCPIAEFDIAKISSRDRLMNALLLVRWNDYHCLQLITADLLLTAGSFIHSCQGYEVMRESSILSGIIYAAAESICSAVPAILETKPVQMTGQSRESVEKPIRGLMVLWHLCCTLKTPKVSQFQQDWVQETLWSIGSQAFIPQASALAISKGQNAKWTDVLAGLLLVRVALSKELLGLFSQCGIS